MEEERSIRPLYQQAITAGSTAVAALQTESPARVYARVVGHVRDAASSPEVT
jgi:hypothetical protein